MKRLLIAIVLLAGCAEKDDSLLFCCIHKGGISCDRVGINTLYSSHASEVGCAVGTSGQEVLDAVKRLAETK